MENNEIKNVTVTEDGNTVEVATKSNLLEKVGTVAKKHGKKIVVVGAAVIGVGALVVKSLLKKDSNSVEPECDEVDDEDYFEDEEVEDTIE